jgi:hypothetical protein
MLRSISSKQLDLEIRVRRLALVEPPLMRRDVVPVGHEVISFQPTAGYSLVVTLPCSSNRQSSVDATTSASAGLRPSMAERSSFA